MRKEIPGMFIFFVYLHNLETENPLILFNELQVRFKKKIVAQLIKSKILIYLKKLEIDNRKL